MNSRTLLNITLALTLSGLIALAVIEPGSNETPAATTLTQLKAEDIHTIRVHSPGHTDVELEKIDGLWKMLAPYTAPANQERLNQLLKITDATSLATYTAVNTDAQQLKLDAPSLTLTLNGIRLDFGGTAPLGGSRYVRIDKSIHLITDRYSHLVQGVATNLISPKLLTASSQITGLQLPTLNIILVDGHWQRANQQAAKINPDQLQQLLDEWRNARAFNVQALDATLETSATESPQTVIVTTDNLSLRFILLRTVDEIILQRHDLGLQYHFSPETGQQLLTLPQPSNA